MTLSDIGNLANIASLIVALFVASKVYKISINLDNSKNNQQDNKDSSFVKFGNTEQSNVSNQ